MKIILNPKKIEKKEEISEKRQKISNGITILVITVLAYFIPMPFAIWLIFVMLEVLIFGTEIEIKK